MYKNDLFGDTLYMQAFHQYNTLIAEQQVNNIKPYISLLTQHVTYYDG